MSVPSPPSTRMSLSLGSDYRFSLGSLHTGLFKLLSSAKYIVGFHVTSMNTAKLDTSLAETARTDSTDLILPASQENGEIPTDFSVF